MESQAPENEPAGLAEPPHGHEGGGAARPLVIDPLVAGPFVAGDGGGDGGVVDREAVVADGAVVEPAPVTDVPAVAALPRRRWSMRPGSMYCSGRLGRRTGGGTNRWTMMRCAGCMG